MKECAKSPLINERLYNIAPSQSLINVIQEHTEISPQFFSIQCHLSFKLPDIMKKVQHNFPSKSP